MCRDFYAFVAPLHCTSAISFKPGFMGSSAWDTHFSWHELVHQSSSLSYKEAVSQETYGMAEIYDDAT